MAETGVMLLTILRGLIEVAGFFLIGQGALFLLAGRHRERNAIYRLFCFLTAPVVRVVRAVAPPSIAGRQVPVLSFALLFCAWIGLALARRALCLEAALVC